MHETKIIEIRDKGTFVPAVAVYMANDGLPSSYLLRRSGVVSAPTILLAPLTRIQACTDPYDWGDRTFQVSHMFLYGWLPKEHCAVPQGWGQIKNGDVLDVEYILGETESPKVSEQFTEPSFE